MNAFVRSQTNLRDLTPRYLWEALRSKISDSRTKRGEPEVFHVVHPLDDVPEEKVDVKKLGLMKMTGATKFALMFVRLYLTCMALLVVYHVLGMAGLV